MPRRAGLLWFVLVAAVWMFCALCCAWEPILRDGWGHVRWHLTTPNTLANIWAFAKAQYETGNPRLGQTVTMLLMTPGPYHAIITPLVELALFGLLTALVLGRAPSPRRVDDALLFATIVAAVLVGSPQSGTLLFYRPFSGNYVYGFVLDLAWLLPYRVYATRVAGPRRRRWWTGTLAALGMAVLGAAAGLCNEHTPPALGALAAVAAVVGWRRERRIPAWMIAGVIGLVVGWLALIAAPGQAFRYAGLATEDTVVERIAKRGLVGDLAMVGRRLLHIIAVLPWVALGAFARARAKPGPTREAAAIAVAGVAALLLISVTLLGSPKDGQRLYFAGCALAAAGLVGWACAQLTARWAQLACAALTAVVLAVIAVRCVGTYASMHREYTARRALIEQAAARAVVVVPRYTVDKNWWTLGEDFDAPNLRQFVANTWNLERVDLAPALAQ